MRVWRSCKASAGATSSITRSRTACPLRMVEHFLYVFKPALPGRYRRASARRLCLRRRRRPARRRAEAGGRRARVTQSPGTVQPRRRTWTTATGPTSCQRTPSRPLTATVHTNEVRLRRPGPPARGPGSNRLRRPGAPPRGPRHSGKARPTGAAAVCHPSRTRGHQTAPARSRSFCRWELHLDRAGAARQGQACTTGRPRPPQQQARAANTPARRPVIRGASKGS